MLFDEADLVEAVEAVEAARLLFVAAPPKLLTPPPPFVIESLEPLIESPTLCIPLSEKNTIIIHQYIDNGHVMRTFSKNIPTNWPIWNDGQNKLSVIWGICS
jgi:hypothetical protein